MNEPSQDPARRISSMRYALIIAIIIIVVLIVILFNQGSDQKSQEAAANEDASQEETIRSKATVTSQEGESYRTTSSGEIQKLQENDEVFENEHIRTKNESRLVLQFSNNDSIRLDQNSSIIFTQEENNIHVIQEEGRAYHNVSTDEAHEYTVALATGEIKALGTQFDINAYEGGSIVLAFEHDLKYKNDENAEDIQQSKKAEIDNQGNMNVKDLEEHDLKDPWLDFNVDQNTKEEKSSETIEEMKKKIEEQPNKETKALQSKETETALKRTIWLSGESIGDGVRLNWSTSIAAKHGFKIVRALETTPVFPGSTYKYITNSAARSFVWGIGDGKTWNFRVCEYSGDGSCLVYSNNLRVTAPIFEKTTEEKPPEEKQTKEESPSYATGVSLYGVRKGNSVVLEWDISGGSAPKGFKAVWSKEANPVYPGNAYKYLSDGNTRRAVIELESEEIRHFRVCVYQGGSCGAYSNDIAL